VRVLHEPFLSFLRVRLEETSYQSILFIHSGVGMHKNTPTFNILSGKNIDSGKIIDQALIDLLIEKGVFTREEIEAKITALQREVSKKDPYRSSL